MKEWIPTILGCENITVDEQTLQQAIEDMNRETSKQVVEWIFKEDMIYGLDVNQEILIIMEKNTYDRLMKEKNR